jgi:uncharacterized protein (UPF0305 family)
LINSKTYFAAGSIRNTAYDEEFFRVFIQYLDEAITKLKQQSVDGDGSQEKDGEEEDQEGEEEEASGVNGCGARSSD